MRRREDHLEQVVRVRDWMPSKMAVSNCESSESRGPTMFMGQAHRDLSYKPLSRRGVVTLVAGFSVFVFDFVFVFVVGVRAAQFPRLVFALDLFWPIGVGFLVVFVFDFG